MRVPLGWLGEWVDLRREVEADEKGGWVASLAERLTLAGFEVEEILRTGPDLAGVRVAHVVECDLHPNADRLSLCRVDVGDGEPVDIVCGAPNVSAGQRVCVVLPGTVMPDGTKIKKTKIRNVVSNGMICSSRELGLGDEHDGILVLAPDAPIGAAAADVLASGETVFDVAITPNRGDCVSLLGIAREVRALSGGDLRVPPAQPSETSRPASREVRVEIDERDGCYRYVGRIVRGITVGPSPDWLRAKLEAMGVRSINAVVDVSNLVMLEFGQPVHAFDLDTLRGGVVRVRSAREGEELLTLDGETRVLQSADLVIADAERPIALAGVMGGADTEVRDATANLLIESAHFHPSRVRRTARRLGLATEASYRFERSVDRDGIQRAADRVARLIQEIAGGEVLQGVSEAVADTPPHTEEIVFDAARVNRLLGTDLTTGQVTELLARVDVESRADRDGTVHCRIPSHRNDLHIPEDLIEEVARVYGYDRIPTTLPRGDLVPVEPTRRRTLIARASDSLANSGLLETKTFPSLRAPDLEALGLAPDDPRRSVLHIENPLHEHEAHLWTSLVPSLLRCVQQNLSRQVDSVRLFCIGSVFLGRAGELPREAVYATAVFTRAGEQRLWGGDAAPLFFEAKGIAERLLADLRVDAELCPGPAEPYLQPGAVNEIQAQGIARPIGAMGELHPGVAAHFDIAVPCALIELDLSALFDAADVAPRFQPVSRQPRVRRDLAVLLDRGQPAAEVLEAIRKAAGSHLVGLEIFDRFEGRGIPEGRVSLAFRLDFQHADRTLKDPEVQKATERVVKMLAHRFGGERR